MKNYFTGRTQEWLLTRRELLQDALSRGSGAQTHAAIAPGMFHEFEKLSQAELTQQLDRIEYALFCLDPDAFPNPFERPGQTIPIFCR